MANSNVAESGGDMPIIKIGILLSVVFVVQLNVIGNISQRFFVKIEKDI